MASLRIQYTRNNLDPNPTKLVDHPEKILAERKKKNNPSSPLLKRFISLSEETIQTIKDLQFDMKFENSLFISKLDLDLSQVIVDIPTLLTIVPKDFYSISKKKKQLFWDSLCEEVRKKLKNIESLRDSDPLDFMLQRETNFFSQYYQTFMSRNLLESLKGKADKSNYIPTKVDIPPKPQFSIVNPFQIVPIVMDDRYAPLALPTNLYDLPQGYA